MGTANMHLDPVRARLQFLGKTSLENRNRVRGNLVGWSWRNCRCGLRRRSCGGSRRFWSRGRFRRRRGGRTRRRCGFGFLLTGREQRGASQNADVFLHSSSWKRDIALNHRSGQEPFLALEIRC
jgi:hypothetical protein